MSKCNKCFHLNVCDGDVGFGYEECPEFISISDVIKVVRCERCKFYNSFNKVEDFDGQCGIHCIEVDKEFYCQYGERK